MKVNFHELFAVNNGAISPKGVVQIGGVTMTPGVSFGGGVSVGGVNLADHVGKDFEVDMINDVAVIKGIY